MTLGMMQLDRAIQGHRDYDFERAFNMQHRQFDQPPAVAINCTQYLAIVLPTELERMAKAACPMRSSSSATP